MSDIIATVKLLYQHHPFEIGLALGFLGVAIVLLIIFFILLAIDRKAKKQDAFKTAEQKKILQAQCVEDLDLDEIVEVDENTEATPNDNAAHKEITERRMEGLKAAKQTQEGD